MKILGGCCRIIGGDTPLHGFAPMVMRGSNYRKTLFIQSLVENGWWGMHPPHPPLDPPLALGMLLNACLLVLRLLFFEKFAGSPKAKSINMVWGPHIARVKTKNTLNFRIGLFKAPLSYVD